MTVDGQGAVAQFYAGRRNRAGTGEPPPTRTS